MAWSLLNHTMAEKIGAIVDEVGGSYAPDVPRALDRAQALAVIHAAAWAHGVRSDSTAGAYAMMNLFEALGLKGWTFQADEAEALMQFRMARLAKPPEVST